jgi:gamma-glutamylcyclotransferase (GGCT)/AIG2-like uncharacterized protein YtfP
MSKYYIAYGSNMDTNQMDYRCPESILVGTGWIHGYELLFKGSLTGFYATIEKHADSKVPCYIWDISDNDEKRLDRYEGFPTFYYKATLPVELADDGTIDGMAYIMHEERELGLPYADYFNNMRDVYASQGWDDRILWNALDKSADHIKSVAKKQ